VRPCLQRHDSWRALPVPTTEICGKLEGYGRCACGRTRRAGEFVPTDEHFAGAPPFPRRHVLRAVFSSALACVTRFVQGPVFGVYFPNRIDEPQKTHRLINRVATESPGASAFPIRLMWHGTAKSGSIALS